MLYSDVQIFLRIADFYRDKGYFNQAIDLYQEELTPKQLANGTEGNPYLSEWNLIGNIVEIYIFLGQYRQAGEVYKIAVDSINSRRKEVFTRRIFTLVEKQQMAYSGSIQYKLNYLNEFEYRLNESIGDSFYRQGLYGKALIFYKKSLLYYQKNFKKTDLLRDTYFRANIFLNIGNSYFAQQQYSQAAEAWQYSLELVEAHPEREKLAQTAMTVKLIENLGNLFLYTKNYDRAIQIYQTFLQWPGKRFIRLNDGEDSTFDKLDAVEKIASVYIAQNNIDAAVNLWLSQLPLVREAAGDEYSAGRNDGEVVVLKKVARLYLQKDDYLMSLKLLSKALSIIDKVGESDPYWLEGHQIEMLLMTGEVFKKIGDITSSDAYLLKAYKKSKDLLLKNRQLEVKDLNTIANSLIGANKYRMAEELIEAYLKNSHRIGTVFVSMGPDTYTTGLASEKNRIEQIEGVKTAFQLLQKALITQNKIEAALEISEQTKSRIMLEIMGLRSTFNSSKFLQPEASSTTISDLSVQQIQAIAKAQDSTLVTYSILPDTSDSRKELVSQQLDSISPFSATPSTTNGLLYIWVVKPDGSLQFRSVNLNSPG